LIDVTEYLQTVLWGEDKMKDSETAVWVLVHPGQHFLPLASGSSNTSRRSRWPMGMPCRMGGNGLIKD
jgi:hypothetical protein